MTSGGQKNRVICMRFHADERGGHTEGLVRLGKGASGMGILELRRQIMRASYLGVFLVLFVGLLAAPSQANVRFEGSVSYQVTGSRVVMNVDRIRNTSSNRTTGTLNLRLFMTTGPSPFGTGWEVAQRSLHGVISNQPDGRLSPGASFEGIQVFADFVQPPPGTYYVHLLVSEFPNLQTSLDVVTFSQTVTYTDAGGGGAGENPNPTGGGWTPQTATLLDLNSRISGRLEGTLGAFGGFYRFEIPQAGTLTMRVSGPAGTTCAFWDSRVLADVIDEPLATDSIDARNPECRLVVGVTSGTYIAHVFGRFDVFGDFDLFVEFAPSETPTTPPPSSPGGGQDGAGSGLAMTGFIQHIIDPNFLRVTIQVGEISNNRSGGQSGSLRIYMWASRTRDWFDDPDAYLLAISDIGSLAGGSKLAGHSDTVAYGPPGESGTYWISFELAESNAGAWTRVAYRTFSDMFYLDSRRALERSSSGGGGGSFGVIEILLGLMALLLGQRWRGKRWVRSGVGLGETGDPPQIRRTLRWVVAPLSAVLEQVSAMRHWRQTGVLHNTNANERPICRSNTIGGPLFYSRGLWVAFFVVLVFPVLSGCTVTDARWEEKWEERRKFAASLDSATREGDSEREVYWAGALLQSYQKDVDQERSSIIGDTFFPLSFKFLADSHARMALAYLANDQPDLARRHYFSAFQSLFDGYAYADERQATAHRRTQIVGFLTGGLALIGGHQLDKAGADGRILQQQGIEILTSALTAPPPVSMADTIDPVDRDIVRFPAYIRSGHTRVFEKVGRVSLVRQSGRTSYCTGAPIGSRLVLTNAHCVTDERGVMDVKSASFVYEYGGFHFPRQQIDIEEDLNRTRYSVLAIHTHRGLNGGWSLDYLDDWAILVLDESRKLPAWFGWAGDVSEELGGSGGFYLAGYSSDLNGGRFLTVDWGCSLLRRHGPSRSASHFNIEHNCARYRGASGSPIVKIKKRDGEFTNMIYALHHSGRGRGERVGFAVSPSAWGQTARALRESTQ